MLPDRPFWKPVLSSDDLLEGGIVHGSVDFKDRSPKLLLELREKRKKAFADFYEKKAAKKSRKKAAKTSKKKSSKKKRVKPMSEDELAAIRNRVPAEFLDLLKE